MPEKQGLSEDVALCAGAGRRSAQGDAGRVEVLPEVRHQGGGEGQRGAGMNKVCLLVAAHCPPKVLKLTLGTWLEAYDRSYAAEVYVGVHGNYAHYHPGLDEIRALEPPMKLTWVDEMDWGRPMAMEGGLAHVMRYSEMHARSLLGMMRRARSECPDMTHAAFLDHDLVFKMDFVEWGASLGYDLSGTLFKDRTVDQKVPLDIGGEVVFAPKISAWHLVVSRIMFDSMLEWPCLVAPCMRGERMFDTLSLSHEWARRWGMRVRILPEATANEMVVHAWSMSFNYGAKQGDSENYGKKVALYESEYDRRFPKGIGHLLGKLG